MAREVGRLNERRGAVRYQRSLWSASFIALAFTLLLPVRAFADTVRSKVGLVLAGGGALGFAHVGVLKVLDRERIPVDFVSGTSMGAIVGAAYASGCTVSELETTLDTVDWKDLFNENAPRAGLEYRLKPGRDRELVGDVKIGLKDGKIVLPRGAITGVKILPLFQRLFERAPSPVRFDDLPVPYRAIAADIETGQEVVLSHGDLALAARASMSVPGAFEPVELGGRLLVDGGIADNLPVEVTRKLGADVLIAIELPATFKKRDELRSPLDISAQIISLLLAQNSQRQLDLLTPRDVLVVPDLKGYTPTDFDKAEELIRLGEEAAEAMAPSLRTFSVSQEEFAAYTERRTRRPDRRYTTIEFVRVLNHSDMLKDQVNEAVQVKAGEPLDRTKLDESLRRIFELGYFSDVRYSLIEENGKQGVEFTTEEKRWFERFFRVGAAMENDMEGQSWNSIAVAYRDNSVFSGKGAAEGVVEIGTAPRAQGELILPMTESGATFFQPTAELSQAPILLQENGDIYARYVRRTALAGAFIGERLGPLGEAAIGIERGIGSADRQIGSSDLPDTDYDLGYASARLSIDTLDDADFPRTGYRFNLSPRVSSTGLGASDGFNFQQLTGLLTKPVPMGDWTFLFRGDFGSTFGALPPELHYTIGGFFDFSGYTKNSILASDYGIGRFILTRKLFANDGQLFGMDAFVGSSLELGTFRRDIALLPDNTLIVSGSVFTALDTPLIPVYVGIGLAEEGQRNVYFAIGRAFRPRRQ